MKTKIIILILTIFISSSGCDNSKISFEGEKNFDLEKAIKNSEKERKPLLIYFTSSACVNCRTAEKIILSNSEVPKLISNNYEFATLDVDDKELIENKEKKRNFGGKIIKRNGGLNRDYQFKLTRAGSNPVFAIVKDTAVSKKIFYDFRDMDKFLIFLNDNKID